MTIINRALHKAYKRRSDHEPAVAVDERAAATGGWAQILREPARPDPQPDGATAAGQTPAFQVADDAALAPHAPPRERKIEGPVVAPAGSVVRVDSPHPAAKGPILVETAPATRSMLAADAARTQSPGIWAWPPIVQKLLSCAAAGEINRLAGRLKQMAAERGLGCVALSGTGRLAGRTSLCLTLAKALTDTCGARVVVVDADFTHPDVARTLSIRPRSGLWDVACENHTAPSPLATLVPGKLSLVPLVARVSPEAIDRRKIAAMQTYLRRMRRGYDLVLIDAGPWESLIPPLVFENLTVDAFICVSRHNDAEEPLDDASYRQPGVEWLGTIETFCPAMRELQIA